MLANGKLTASVVSNSQVGLFTWTWMGAGVVVLGGLRKGVQSHRETHEELFTRLQYLPTGSRVPIYYSSRTTRIRITLEIRVLLELNIELIC